MFNPRNPQWLFIINSLPLVLLFLLFYGEFCIIQSLLSAESILLWKQFGGTLAALGIMTAAYALFLVRQKKEIPVYYGFAALIGYILFLYVYGHFVEDILPSSIPQWMVSQDIILYTGTFLMPTLAHALFILVSGYTRRDKEHKAWKNFVAALMVPAAYYLFTFAILPFWQPVFFVFNPHFIILCLITGVVLFLFFLIRFFYILVVHHRQTLGVYQWIWKIPVAIIMPLCGLMVNNGGISDRFFLGTRIFGDFTNSWFYILAILNGIVLCLPDTGTNLSEASNKWYRMALFSIRSVTFSYSLYFFMVFLPFLPLSLVAILLAGVGFLMLTPLLLFILHTQQLSQDYSALQQYFSKKLLIPFMLACSMFLPAVLTLSYVQDKHVLSESLDYLYTPNYAKPYDIDTASLDKTLHVVRYYKDNRGNGLMAGNLPYLTRYFKWLVLDNMTLSDAKIHTMEQVFFGKTTFHLQDNTDPITVDSGVSISNIRTRSTYNPQQNAWLSWIDIEITRKGTSTNTEYATSLELPDGCWISDYYLRIGDSTEMGILSEKKAAMWLYSQIRNVRRDPGILYYLNGNRVMLRVFPFAPNEKRKTGIEFLHKEPVEISIDGHKVRLGNDEIQQQNNMPLATNDDSHAANTLYISVAEKNRLPTIQRAPYYHFIVDLSSGNEERKEDYIRQIESVLKNNSLRTDNMRITLSNTYARTLPSGADWKAQIRNSNCSGGFFLDRAIRTILCESYRNVKGEYPCITVVSDSLNKAILEKDFSDLAFTYPDNTFFYEIGENDSCYAHSLLHQPEKRIEHAATSTSGHVVFAYPDTQKPIAFLANDGKPAIVLRQESSHTTEAMAEAKNWQSALALQGTWMSHTLHPENTDSEWRRIVQQSFRTRILSPVSSYIVVENEAQKALLKKKQEQVLAGNPSLDLGEDVQRMSEPDVFLMLGVVALCFFLYKTYRRKCL